MNFDLIIDILSILLPSILSCIAIYISIKALKQNDAFQLESQRANIVLSFDKTRTDVIFEVNNTIRVLIKNHGNSPGTIKSIITYPDMKELFEEFKISNSKKKEFDAEHIEFYEQTISLFDIKDTTLTPGQTLLTYIPLNLLSDKVIEVHIEYSSLGRNFTFNESLDLKYRPSLSLSSPGFKVTASSKDEKNDPTLKALKFIGESIREASDKLY